MKASEFEKYYCAGQPVEINEALAAKLKPCCDYTSLFYMDKQSLREKYQDVPNISRDAASEDIEIFFDILKYAYAGYDYYSDKVDFEKLKADIIAKIPAVGISTDGLKEIIFEALYPHINDTHFAFIGEKNLNMKHCFTAYFSDLLLEKHGGRVKVISGCATLCGKESDMAEISENLFPTLPSHDGCERFLFGIYSEKPVDALTLGGEELPLHRCKTDLCNPKDGFLYDREILGIPAVYQTTYGLPDEKTGEFSGMGEKYKNAKNLIWSVLGNSGGDSRFPEMFVNALNGYANWEMDYAVLSSPLAGDNRESAHEKSYEIHSLPENNPDSSKFGGKLWLLQNKNVASSGESAVMYARSVKNSVSVGSATCGCGQFGDILGYHLPNSNILFCMGYKVFNMDGFEEGKGLAPDYWLDSDDPVTALAEYINEENGK